MPIVLIVVTIIGALAIAIVRDEEYKTTPQYNADVLQQEQDYLSKDVDYIRDTATGICFARFDGRSVSLATVDCSKLGNVKVTDFTSN